MRRGSGYGRARSSPLTLKWGSGRGMTWRVGAASRPPGCVSWSPIALRSAPQPPMSFRGTATRESMANPDARDEESGAPKARGPSRCYARSLPSAVKDAIGFGMTWRREAAFRRRRQR